MGTSGNKNFKLLITTILAVIVLITSINYAYANQKNNTAPKVPQITFVDYNYSNIYGNSEPNVKIGYSVNNSKNATVITDKKGNFSIPFNIAFSDIKFRLSSINSNGKQSKSTYFTIKVTKHAILNYIDKYIYPEKLEFLATYCFTQDVKQNTIIDLSAAWNEYSSYGIKPEGIYGGGSTEKDIKIIALDKSNKVLAEKIIKAGNFLLEFKNACKVQILGDSKNLYIDFIPVKPIIIKNDSKNILDPTNWYKQKDPYRRVYYIFAMSKAEYNVRGSEQDLIKLSHNYCVYNKSIDSNTAEECDNYKRVMFLTKSETFSAQVTLNVSHAVNGFENEYVKYIGNSTISTPIDYESQILSMRKELIKQAFITHIPDSAVMKKFDVLAIQGFPHGGERGIFLPSEDIDLNEPYDYYVHLHEMSHTLDYQNVKTQIRAFTEGYAITLAENVLKSMGNSYNVKQNFAGLALSQEQLNNFETYYKDVDDWDCYMVGYNFMLYLQDRYGQDVIKNICKLWIDKYSGKVPEVYYDNVKNKNEFIKVIKKATSEKVFVEYKEWYQKNTF